MAVVGVGLAAGGSGRDIVGDVGDVGRRIGGKAAILGRRTQRRTVVIADRVENAAVGDPNVSLIHLVGELRRIAAVAQPHLLHKSAANRTVPARVAERRALDRFANVVQEAADYGLDELRVHGFGTHFSLGASGWTRIAPIPMDAFIPHPENSPNHNSAAI
ncbi:Uncharacterised protein [Mycobacterium tuberculosis]|uniref:Uncharacterized protein n=1 Tax=Mycobacterium tuberculosis TaxID=1773 RepID=A0A655AT03_MYCTX|nr:Uncharacterised protein [Mycobacterium tuberculosis]